MATREFVIRTTFRAETADAETSADRLATTYDRLAASSQSSVAAVTSAAALLDTAMERAAIAAETHTAASASSAQQAAVTAAANDRVAAVLHRHHDAAIAAATGTATASSALGGYAALARTIGANGGTAFLSAAAAARALPPPINQATAAASVAAAAVARLDANTGQAAAAARRYGKDADAAHSRAASTASHLLGRLAGIAGAYLGVHAAMRAVTGILRQQADLEQSTLSIAAIVGNSFEFQGNQFAGALATSKRFIRDLASDAAVLPGELADFIATAKAISPAILATEGSMQALRRRTADVAIAADILSLSAQDAGNMMQRILSGRAGSENPFAMGLRSAGVLRHEFEALNRMNPAERLAAVFGSLEALTSNSDFRGFLSRSLNTQLSTLRESLFGIGGIAGRIGTRVERAILPTLINLNDWFARNEDKVQRLADQAADVVVPALVAATEALKFGVVHARAIAVALTAAAGAAGAIRLGMIVPGAGTGGRNLATTAATGAMALSPSVLLAGMQRRLRSWFDSLLIPALTVPAAMQGRGGMPAPPVDVLSRAGIARLAGGLGVLGAALWATTAVVSSTRAAIARNAGGAGDLANQTWADARASWSRLFDTVSGMLFPLRLAADLVGRIAVAPIDWIFDATERGQGLAEAFALLGSAVGGIAEILVWGADTMGGVIAGLSAAVGTAIDRFGNINWLEARKSAYWSDMGDAVGQAAIAAFKGYSYAELPGKWAAIDPERRQREEEKIEYRRKLAAETGQNLNGDIIIQMHFERDVSPDRIAFGVLDELKRLKSRQPQLRPNTGY